MLVVVLFAPVVLVIVEAELRGDRRVIGGPERWLVPVQRQVQYIGAVTKKVLLTSGR